VNAELVAAIQRRKQRELSAKIAELKRTNPRAFRRYSDLVMRACQETPSASVPSPMAFLRDYLRHPENYPPDPDSWEAKQPELAARYYARETKAQSPDEGETNQGV
jgi:hypothetical protein